MSDPIDTPPSSPAKRWYHNTWTWLVLGMALIFTVRSSVLNHYLIPSGSMEPTLMPGDYVTVDMRAFGVSLPGTRIDLWATGTPQRGDIVVFPSPKNGVRLIKRVVAVGGDRVAVRNGHVLLNGQSVADGEADVLGNHRVVLDLAEGGGPDIEEVVVPPGQVLLLGDHRGRSADGRFFGFVDVDALYGRAMRVYWRSGQGLAWDAL
jgi:signal peptidase I